MTVLKGEECATYIVTENEEVPVDLVLLATGVRPNTAFLESTEIERLRNDAIVVD